MEEPACGAATQASGAPAAGPILPVARREKLGYNAPMSSIPARRILLAVALLLLFVSLPLARPFKSPVIDGTITGNGTDWDSDDLAVADPLGDTTWGPNDIQNLWVTYDADNLYIGVRYQVDNNAMLVLIDAGTGTGASNINTLDWYPRNFNFPDSIRVDYIIANWNGSALGVHRITSNTTTVDVTSQCLTANGAKGNFFYEAEVKIPWNTIYGLGAGRVIPGALVRVVTLIAGGDHWNGPDSAPDNPGMNGSGAATTLSNFFRLPVDRTGTGYPTGYVGAIEGTVQYDNPSDNTTVATVTLFREDTDAQMDTYLTAPGGGAYRFDRLPDRSYRVEVSARGYARAKAAGLAIAGQDTLRGVDFLLTKAGKITGQVVFSDGPGRPATVAAYDATTGEIAGDGAVDIPATGGSYELLVPDGGYRVVAEAEGYVPDTVAATISGSDSIRADTLFLRGVRATNLVLINDAGEEIPSINTTVSFPDSGIYFYARATIEARDDLGRRDYFDLDGYLSDVRIRATKLDNLSPPRGDVRFYSTDTIPGLTSLALAAGRGSFLVTDDNIEVLRVFTETYEGTVSGRFKVGIRSAEPEFLELSTAASSIVADGTTEAAVSARLLDASLNPVRIPGVAVNFSFASSSTGKGAFKIPSVLTSSDGDVVTSLTATGAGTLHVTASATYLNKDLVVIGAGGTDYVAITVVAGPPASIHIASESDVMGLGESMPIRAQLVDAYGNPVSQGGYTISFSRQPASAGSVVPSSIALDASGQAAVTFQAAQVRSAVAVTGTSSPSLPVNEITFLIDRILTFTDPKAPEPSPPHSLKDMDLTVTSVGNGPEGLEIKVKFASGWDGVHLGLIMEAARSAAGAPGDPFGFPISYGQAYKPEYALVYKYSSNDYADFRKWDGTQWIWWNDTDEAYEAAWADGANINAWISKDTASVTYKIPFSIFEGTIPDSVRFEVYLMQETDVKRSAFDSDPSDSTLNLNFDPLDPSVDWSVTQTPVTLHHYSPPFAINRVFPPAPTLTNAAADPASVTAGGTVLFSVRAADAGGGIGNVLIDLSPIGGPRFQPMHDDGADGDEAADDMIYSYRYLTDPGIAGGQYALPITARDSTNVSSATATVSFTIEGQTAPIRAFADSLNDDHGPNQFGKDGLYYLYPTNAVFFRRAFDIEDVSIFETSKIVAGEIIPSFAFRVKMGKLPNPTEPGAANWNPLYAGINIHKVDIYIDAFKGGATEGLPNRQNGFAKWDAWDYAIVMEGWYKGVIASNNQNTPQAWSSTVKKSDRDIILVADYANNTITAVVSKEALGNPSKEEMLNWDIMVLMTSHDGNSTDLNFGDTRWVDAGTSEWRFGGGNNSDRDANIIDLLASPGFGKRPGREQPDLLNYKTPEAVARVEKGLKAVELEITAFEDQGPPAIDVGSIVNETVPFTALVNAPLYVTSRITDDDEVSQATFFWRADSMRADAWMGELEMGYAGEDIWSVDLPVDEITSKVPIAALDSTRSIEFVITAEDPSGNVATTPLYTMEIPKPARFWTSGILSFAADTSLIAPEGTRVSIPAASIPAALREVPFRLTLSPRYLDEFNLPPRPASSINVIRTISLDAILDEGDPPATAPLGAFDEPIEISFHYPQYAVGTIDENLLAVYEYYPGTDTWVLIGGNVNPYGNIVTVAVKRTGTYGIFYDPSLKYVPGDVFSGVVFSPNPFSPNGDGIYDETNISFFLSKEATVTVEIYNIDGDRVRILQQRVPFTAEDTPDKKPRRITGMTWDGRDNMGRVVPYGIYIARFTTTFSQASGQRTIRTNAAVAVIQ
jgi:hypothetical protein